MSNMLTIDIDAVLSDEAKLEIAESEYRSAVARALETSNDVERFVGNVSYVTVSSIVEQYFDGGFEKLIIDKVTENLQKITKYDIFAKKSYLNATDSKGQQILDKAISTHAELIDKQVKKAFESIDKDYLKDSIQGAVENAVRDVFNPSDKE